MVDPLPPIAKSEPAAVGNSVEWNFDDEENNHKLMNIDTGKKEQMSSKDAEVIRQTLDRLGSRSHQMLEEAEEEQKEESKED